MVFLLSHSSFFVIELEDDELIKFRILKQINDIEYKQIDSTFLLSGSTVGFYYKLIGSNLFIIELGVKVDQIGMNAILWNYRIENDKLHRKHRLKLINCDPLFFEYEPEFKFKGNELLIMQYNYKKGIIVNLNTEHYKEMQLNDNIIEKFKRQE